MTRSPLFAPRVGPGEVAEMRLRYARGESLRAIALALGLSHEGVRLHLLAAGVVMRPRHVRRTTPPTTTPTDGN